MDPEHRFDPTRQPVPFKICTGLEPIALPLDRSSLGLPDPPCSAQGGPVSPQDLFDDGPTRIV